MDGISTCHSLWKGGKLVWLSWLNCLRGVMCFQRRMTAATATIKSNAFQRFVRRKLASEQICPAPIVAMDCIYDHVQLAWSEWHALYPCQNHPLPLHPSSGCSPASMSLCDAAWRRKKVHESCWLYLRGDSQHEGTHFLLNAAAALTPPLQTPADQNARVQQR